MKARFDSVDGLRALSVLWMVSFHTVWLLGHFMPPDAFIKVLHAPALHFIAQGHFGVDVFFVISGYLIAYYLMAEYKRSGEIRVSHFYARRVFRILPAYLAVLAFGAAIIEYNRETAWANILFINNFLPYQDQFLGWTWSLAIEEQFYLFFPPLLLLLFATVKNRHVQLAVYVTLVLAGVALQWHLLRSAGITVLPPHHPHVGEAGFRRYFDLIYDKPYVRCGTILQGVIVAHLMQFHDLKARFAARPRLAKFATAVACLALLLVVAMPYRGASDAVLFLTFQRFKFGTVIAALLACALCSEPRGHWLSRFLGAKFWQPIAELSYGAYLLHPIVILSFYTLGLKFFTVTPTLLLLFIPGVTLATFALAFPLYRWLEQPCRAFGKARLRPTVTLPEL